MEDGTNTALVLLFMPILAIIGVTLNLLIRARGGRSFTMRLKGFGVDLTVESLSHRKEENKR